MKAQTVKNLYISGIALWIVIIFFIIRLKFIMETPIIAIGLLYPIIILLVNAHFVGNVDKDSKDELDYGTSTPNTLFNKSVAVATSIFALSYLIRKGILTDTDYRKILFLMTLAVLFSATIIPVYFTSNQENPSIVHRNSQKIHLNPFLIHLFNEKIRKI